MKTPSNRTQHGQMENKNCLSLSNSHYKGSHRKKANEGHTRKMIILVLIEQHKAIQARVSHTAVVKKMLLRMRTQLYRVCH